MVATGDELHERFSVRRVLFPFDANFATNVCLLDRDDGVLAMGARGYLPVPLRDCTVGIETRDTLEGLLSTRLAVQHVERSRRIRLRRLEDQAAEGPGREPRALPAVPGQRLGVRPATRRRTAAQV